MLKNATMSKPEMNKDRKQSPIARLKSLFASKTPKDPKAAKMAMHARNRKESKFWIKAKPVMEALWKAVEIAGIGFFGTLTWHVLAKLIMEGTAFLSQLVFYRLLIAGGIAGAIVFAVLEYRKQKRLHLHKYTKKPCNSEMAKFLNRKPLLYASAVFAAIIFVPYLMAAICDFVYCAWLEAITVLEMVFVGPVVVMLVLIFVVKAGYGLFKAEVANWDRIAEKNAPKR